MPLRPDEIENREFASSLRGFDKHEVRAFLRRVASDVEELETKITSRESAWADGGEGTAQGFAPLPDATQIDEDRFGALGDRIANLLRQAHDVATETREQSELKALELRSGAEDELERARVDASRLREEAESLKSEADRLHVEAASVRQEAEEYAARVRGEVEHEAHAIRDRAEVEGSARLDERRALLEQAEAEAATEREAAFAEASEARQQVATLLEEARAQSEFIKREAEEIVRAKVRTNLDQAQRRLDVLRNTETSSRNRILTAQRELEAALNRLDAESLSELGAQAEQDVLLEAEQRAIDADYPPFLSPDRSGEATDTGTYEVLEADVIEGDVIEGDVIEADVIEGDVIESDGPETFYRPSTDAYTAPDLGEDSDAEDTLETADVAAPENEDALARLVREAMQRVVDDARNENR